MWLKERLSLKLVETRLKKVRELLKEKDLDALLITGRANVFYLSLFKSTNACILLTREDNYLLTDARYIDRAKYLEPLLRIKLVRESLTKELKGLFEELRLEIIGYEKDEVTCEFLEALKEKGREFVGVSKILVPLRIVKDEFELELIKEAVRLTDEVFKKGVSFIKEKISAGESISELSLRGYLVYQMFNLGAEGESFPSIVASGRASAIPHWETSDSQIEINAPLLIDMGLVWKGYSSDFTRMLYIGKPDKEFLRYYELVKEAWFVAFERVKVGVPVAFIDSAVREYFKKKGVDRFFVHATGHGIGIEIHEEPRVSYRVPKDVLIEEGMVFTIEPGLYFKENFGIRLENVVFVEGGVGKVFSSIPLELEVVEV